MTLDPSAAELAAGHRRKKNCGLAAELNGASHEQAEKKLELSRRKKYG
jgi:hypothetical protein